MQKSDYDRYSLNGNLLKKVIIRVDLEGATSIESIVEAIKSNEIGEKFARYQMRRIPFRGSNSQLGLRLQTNDRPDGMTSESYHVFFEYQPSRDDVELIISNNFVCVTLKCRDYKNIDPYFELITAILYMLLDSDHYVMIKRLGIRKINAYEVPEDSDDKYFAAFEESAFKPFIKDTNFADEIGGKKCGVSYVELKDHYSMSMTGFSLNINNNRLLRFIDNPNDRKGYFQAILDMDGYTHNIFSLIKSHNKNRIMEIMNEINDVLFQLYKLSVTIGYLNEHAKHE